MKATELTQICPYTGLRSFTEEESLYFKGRDLQVDQITALLEQNKFLMVTGASGEGKSSLVYAGLIPNARAGFFKARYTNWVVADFRPERSPVTNMANALADKFNSKPSSIETELRRGFSSLIDLYTNSDFYTDEEDEHFKKLAEPEKKDAKRKSANLMILVDQFEEFFTNPENFYNEAPSQDSQIVVNLILETARIAIKKNLPVYVVCTMRSDYIGQCSAFRGLPEYIGFSQFFVPRLKRKDLKQVVEEPAILSGNRISQRLIERLVYDLSEGVDQLPILQHALSQIWLAADHGNQEMDLIHYAMVGGMPENELPDEDRQTFQKWFAQLPKHQQNYYVDCGLSKIIEMHASMLYDNAWEYYNKNHPENLITQKEAKRIIALTFSCLTKIDNSRAVRNRMSLGEITEIINTPSFTPALVSNVLSIYREEGNSFIRPFKIEDPTTHTLSEESVLDITHESLIRNWGKLNKWANQEFEFNSTYQDFKKQLHRWKDSGKSSNFLLPIGPLTYFENWYQTCKPNAGWIRRYAEVHEDKAKATQHAEEVLTDIREFLRRSARKVLLTRAFMKYGAQRIATIFAILIMLVLSGFYWYDAEQKVNARVVQRVRNEAFDLIQSKEVGNQGKSTHLLIEERYKPGSLIPYLNSLSYETRVSLAIETYKLLQYFDKNMEGPLKKELLAFINVNFTSPEPSIEPVFMVTELNKFLVLLLRDNYYTPDPEKQKTISELTALNCDLTLKFYKDKSLFRPSIPYELNLAIQLWLTSGKVTPEKIQQILNSISPLSNAEAEAAFRVYYPKGSFEPNGRQPNDFNSGFHTLSSLYAALGDLEGAEWSFKQLLENNQRPYFELARVFNSPVNVLGYLYQYNHRDQVPRFLKWIESNTTGNPPLTLYRNTIIRSGYITQLYVGANIEKTVFRSYRGYIYPNLYLIDRSAFSAIVEDYEQLLREIKDPSEREFQLAMSCKRKAMFMHKYWFDRKMPIDEGKLNSWLKEALDHYAKVDGDYLEGKVSSTLIYFGDGVRTSDVSRRSLFIYPDYRDGWFSDTYHSDYFFKYLHTHGLLSALYKSGADLQAIHFWIAKAFEVWPFPAPQTIDNDYEFTDEVFNNIITFVDQHPEGREFDKNLLYMILANRAFQKGDSANGMKYYKQFDQLNIARAADRYEYIEKTFFLNMMNQLCVNLAGLGKITEATALAERYTKNEEKVFSYIYMAEQVYKHGTSPNTFVYLDSAFSKSKNVDFTDIPEALDSRFNLILLLSRIGSEPINTKAAGILRDIPEGNKFDAVFALVLGVANEGNFYRARTSIPSTLTESQDLECRSMILLEACKKQDLTNSDNRWKAMDRWLDWQWNYVYYLPN